MTNNGQISTWVWKALTRSPRRPRLWGRHRATIPMNVAYSCNAARLQAHAAADAAQKRCCTFVLQVWCLEHDKMSHSWLSARPEGDRSSSSSSVTSLRLCISNRGKEDADFQLCIWMEPQTTHVPLKNEQYWCRSLLQQSLLIYRRPKLLNVEWSRRADGSQETHCNKTNCHCFLAELYKWPHQSSSMGPPPPAINQSERNRAARCLSIFQGCKVHQADKCFCVFLQKAEKPSRSWVSVHASSPAGLWTPAGWKRTSQPVFEQDSYFLMSAIL